MSLNLSLIVKEIVGKTVERPNKESQGTLSGHAAGEPFEKLVYSLLKETAPQKVFKQFEYLNDLYLRHPQHITLAQRQTLFNSPTAHYLLSRGKSATSKWSPENIFEEKQNDTADIVICQDHKFHLVDVKTRNINKDAQPPNIISAAKLAEMCARILDNEDYDTIDITYISVHWLEEGDKLRCTDARLANLFAITPEELYINWASAMQIQFHIEGIDQSWTGSVESWAREYLCKFVSSARQHANKMIDKYVTPYLKYIQ